MMHIVELFRVDYDDYPVGNSLEIVGPFGTFENAFEWTNNHTPTAGKTWVIRGVTSIREYEDRNRYHG